jgi:hypothetical protein
MTSEKDSGSFVKGNLVLIRILMELELSPRLTGVRGSC